MLAPPEHLGGCGLSPLYASWGVVHAKVRQSAG